MERDDALLAFATGAAYFVHRPSDAAEWPRRPARAGWVQWFGFEHEDPPPATHDGDHWHGPGGWLYIAHGGEWVDARDLGHTFIYQPED